MHELDLGDPMHYICPTQPIGPFMTDWRTTKPKRFIQRFETCTSHQKCNVLYGGWCKRGYLENLERRGVQMNSILCSLCNSENETIEHIFFLCQCTRSIWTECYNWFAETTVQPSSTDLHFLQHWGQQSSTKTGHVRMVIWASVVWNIWKARNLCL